MCTYMWEYMHCVYIYVYIPYIPYTIPLLIFSGGYVRDGAVCGIYITKHIIIDVHHRNSTFQLTAFVYMFYRYIYITIHRLYHVHMTAHMK